MQPTILNVRPPSSGPLYQSAANVNALLFGAIEYANSGGGPANNPPTGSITSPLNGAVISSLPFTVTANLTDSDGTVIQARLNEDGAYIGTDVASPWEWAWNPSNGLRTLFVEVTDDDFATFNTASIVVTVDVPPGAGAGAAAAGGRSALASSLTLNWRN